MSKAWLLSFIFVLSVAPVMVTANEAKPASQDLFSPEGYRIDRYRSPTPNAIDDVQTISTSELKAALDANPAPIVIDVINSEYRAARFIETKPHYSVPGAYWLPNTGRGNLDQPWLDYLVKNVRKLTMNNQDHPVVVMCKSDCWLSWNATRRLKEAGFANLFWYKNGIDSWKNADLPVEVTAPVPPEI
ncbi:rhodanese-like domain-containing protein [Marinobacter sp.]|uniref:rhodanese-like domain-containing protein n=1 Tax=Marinobacter sp. TaxID=50741 RepID=UPI003F96E471